MFRRIDERTLVAGQITPADVAAAAAQGIGMIVNNRPDGEQPGQPEGRVIEAAAAAAGIRYCAIPVGGPITPEQIEAMAQAIEEADGQLLAFCAAGVRSAWLWGLARAYLGDEPDEIVRKAAGAGYDLSPLRIR